MELSNTNTRKARKMKKVKKAHCESCRMMRFVADGKTTITLWDPSLGKSTEGKAHKRLTTEEALTYLRNGKHRNCQYAEGRS